MVDRLGHGKNYWIVFFWKNILLFESNMQFRENFHLTHHFIKVVWYPKIDQKVCFNMVKKDQLCAVALKKFESFTQKGCYGHQPQPSEAVFYSTDANNSRFFTKQDLTVQ